MKLCEITKEVRIQVCQTFALMVNIFLPFGIWHEQFFHGCLQHSGNRRCRSAMSSRWGIGERLTELGSLEQRGSAGSQRG
jgi:hypothetical protein